MKKQQLVSLVESVTMDDLKSLVALKGKMETLGKKKRELERGLAAVNRQMDALENSIEKLAGKGTRLKATVKRRKKSAVRKKAKQSRRPGKAVARRTRKRVPQRSLSSLVVEVLKEKKKPMKVAEICTAVLEEKKYKTRAKNFKSQLRILLYKNEKGLFKKKSPGLFVLARNAPRGGK